MKKVSNIKERIKVFAENTGENQDVFFEKIGVTSANFRGKKLQTGVNADLIEKIVSLYPDIDLHWLITGKRQETEKESFVLVNEPAENYINEEDIGMIEMVKEFAILKEKLRIAENNIDKIMLLANIDDELKAKQSFVKKNTD